jgi:hypothetical protein
MFSEIKHQTSNSRDSGHVLCPHNRQKSRCVDCGGNRWACTHGRQKNQCKACRGGSGLCEHGRQKRQCKRTAPESASTAEGGAGARTAAAPGSASTVEGELSARTAACARTAEGRACASSAPCPRSSIRPRWMISRPWPRRPAGSQRAQVQGASGSWSVWFLQRMMAQQTQSAILGLRQWAGTAGGGECADARERERQVLLLPCRAHCTRSRGKHVGTAGAAGERAGVQGREAGVTHVSPGSRRRCFDV